MEAAMGNDLTTNPVSQLTCVRGAMCSLATFMPAIEMGLLCAFFALLLTPLPCLATGYTTSKIIATDGAEGDYFGISGAVSGNIAVVGAQRDD
jgi:hypothetical protein